MHDDQPHAPWGTADPSFWEAPAQQAASVQEQPQPQLPHDRGEDEPPAEARSYPEADRDPAAAEEPEPHAASADSSAQSAGQHAEPQAPPEAYRQRIAAISAAFNTPQDQERLAHASIDAEKLDREITATFGEAHAHTINIRELRGWLAFLMGQPDVAARWYLHTTGLQAALRGSGHKLTHESAQRAVHTWNSITDPQAALALGPELLGMLAAVMGEASAASGYVRSRLDAMSAQQQ